MQQITSTLNHKEEKLLKMIHFAFFILIQLGGLYVYLTR